MDNPFEDAGADDLFYGGGAGAGGRGGGSDYVSLGDGSDQDRFPGEEEEIQRHQQQYRAPEPVSRQTSVSRASEVFPGQDEEEHDFGGGDGLPQRTSSFANSHSGNGSGRNGASMSEVERREREVALRERRLAEREAKLAKNGGGGRPKNWPCSCMPLARHAIAEDIPEDRRAFVRKLYALLLLGWLGLLCNLLSFVVIWIERGNYGKETLWSAGYLLFGLPGGWFLWYRNAYYGSKGDSAARWILFFVFFGIHLLFAACLAVGIPYTNTAGLLVLIRYAKHSTIFVFTMTCTVLWGLNLVLGLLMMRSAAWHWKHGGETELEKQVREEIARQARAAAKKEAKQAWDQV